ncbi:MAG: polysaccharide deacetylase family protein [Chloroflexi bacterium]|nr:polysaccharide deacetylase family protein [Chloroflexota bacterium]
MRASQVHHHPSKTPLFFFLMIALLSVLAVSYVFFQTSPQQPPAPTAAVASIRSTSIATTGSPAPIATPAIPTPSPHPQKPSSTVSMIPIRVINAATSTPLACPSVNAGDTPLKSLPDGWCALPIAAPDLPSTLSAEGFETQQVHPVPHSTIKLSPTPAAVAQLFGSALQHADWQSAWRLLDPTQQAQWPNEAAYIRFLQAKFAPQGRLLISTVSVKDPHPIAGWHNTLTGTSTPRSVIQVMLSVDLHAAHAVNALNPQVDVSPIILQANHGSWDILDPGIAGFDGTVLLPAAPLAKQITVPILMYHHIAPPVVRTAAMSNYDFRLASDLTVPMEHFKQQLDWLQQHGYHSITLTHLLAALYDHAPLPLHPVVLTFDDGYVDAYTYALPLLQAHHMIGEFNIITGFMGKTVGLNSYLTWNQLQVMMRSGMEIESHTVNHADLGTLPADAAANELQESRQTLTDHLGRTPQIICYPAGEPFRSGTAVAQQRVQLLAHQAGYIAGLLDPRRSSSREDARAPLLLPRIRVAGAISLSSFAQLLRYYSAIGTAA